MYVYNTIYYSICKCNIHIYKIKSNQIKQPNQTKSPSEKDFLLRKTNIEKGFHMKIFIYFNLFSSFILIQVNLHFLNVIS